MVRIVKRLAVLALVVVLVVVVAAVGGLAYLTGRALPETSGTIRIAGLDGPVQVQRDATGIAHISAGTSHDLFLAQGFVHAQERMWQMEVWRHASAGRLAELFGGDDQLETDRFIRTLGWRQAAERDMAAIEPDAMAVLEAYAAGVNAWLDANRGDLGLSWIVVGATPEPWTVLDTLTWGKVQAWSLGGNMETELFRYLADARLGDPARTDELFPPYRDGAPIITPGDDAGEGTFVGDADPAPATAASRPAALPGPDRRGLARRRRPVRPAAGADRPGPGRRPRLGPRHRLQRLGGRARALAERRGAAGQRPAPGHLHAVHLVHQRPALHDRRRGLPVRRGRGQLPGRARRRPGPQRAHRVGRDQRRPGRPGPGHRDP